MIKSFTLMLFFSERYGAKAKLEEQKLKGGNTEMSNMAITILVIL